MVEGSIGDDALSIGEEFVSGDALTRGVRRAKEHLSKKDLAGAIGPLEEVLGPMDQAGLYDDSATVEHRFFNNYVDRALFNRIGDAHGRAVVLVPDSYFEAHLLLATAHLLAGRGEAALAESLRLRELSPLDFHCSLLHVRCLETLGRTDQAIDELRRLLAVAHDPTGVSLAYYRMAFFQWQKGNLMTARACYQRSLKFAPDTAGLVAGEMAILAMQDPASLGRELEPADVLRVLSDARIALAPTEETTHVLLECARASLDAEVFPVARNFAQVLGAFGSDDVLAGIIRSLEGAPDS
jgi:tetratricopeptide (TPR) repeat protein